MRLTTDFYERNAKDVARDLLGRHLVTAIGGARCVGRMIETEAYLGVDDPASHSHRGPTFRNRSMYLAGGHAYVYLIYGMHFCFNVVTGREGRGEAVLIRAIEPVEGVAHMIARRGFLGRPLRALVNGPAKVTVALGIGPEADGADLTRDETVWIEPGEPVRDIEVRITPRIGISRASELMMRYHVL